MANGCMRSRVPSNDASPDVEVTVSHSSGQPDRETAKPQEYSQRLQSRVKSFHTDPLHSAAYLSHLAKFLHKPHQISRNARTTNPYRHEPQYPTVAARKTFVYEYRLDKQLEPGGKLKPKLTTFDDIAQYELTPRNSTNNVGFNEVVFMSGRPSAEWLSAIGARYDLDYRFFHQHLSMLPTGQRDWFTAPTLPSRSQDVLRLCIPSIMFFGENRYLDIWSLQKARGDVERQLRQGFRSLHEGIPTDAGLPIVRRVNIHSGDNLVIEQELSICVLQRGQEWTGS